MNKQEKEQILRIENKIDNLSNQQMGLYSEVLQLKEKLEKLDKHIDFIDKTYAGLKGPISMASKFFGRR